MTSWFSRRPVRTASIDGAGRTEAYAEGRIDERRGVDRVVAAPAASTVSVEEAYARGQRDGQRRRRGGSPILGLILLVIVVIGAVMTYLAISRGSFSRGGAVVDRNISTVARKAQAPLRGVEDKAGSALQNAGQNLKQNAGSAP